MHADPLAQDADHDVADEAKAVALDHEPGEPAGDCADDDPGNDRFRGQHGVLLVTSPQLTADVAVWFHSRAWMKRLGSWGAFHAGKRG